jgi:hypothetical protein
MIPKRWLDLLKRLMGLQPGRYAIYLTIGKTECDWSVVPLGKVEKSHD